MFADGWDWGPLSCFPSHRFGKAAAELVSYAIGDLLYVRECWHAEAAYDDDPPRDIPFDACCVLYAADGSWSDHDPMNKAGRFRAAMHMPRWATRLTLKVTDVRVARVQEISEADALAEGVSGVCRNLDTGDTSRDGNAALMNFARLWDSINASRGAGWSENPWVCCIGFSVHRGNVDDLIESGAIS
jgi:hypothetical protein